MPGDEPPKLIIDTDWKAQAQAEKERLAQKSKPASTPTPAAPGTVDAPPGETPMGGPREVGFRDLVSILISQALAYLGAYPDPQTGRAVVALDLAKLHIDLLGVLEQKTKGNLADDESKLLSRALNELRLEFVDVAKMVNQAVQEGRATTIGPGGVVQPGAVPPPGGGEPGSPKLKFPDLRQPG